MWTLIFVIILSFIFLVTGFLIVAAISFGNYFLTKKSKTEGEGKGKAPTGGKTQT